MKQEILNYLIKNYNKWMTISTFIQICKEDDNIIDIFLNNNTYPKVSVLAEVLKDYNEFIALQAISLLRKSTKWKLIKKVLYNTYHHNGYLYKIVGIADEKHFLCNIFNVELSEAVDFGVECAINQSIRIDSVLHHTQTNLANSRGNITLDSEPWLDSEYEDGWNFEKYFETAETIYDHMLQQTHHERNN